MPIISKQYYTNKYKSYVINPYFNVCNTNNACTINFGYRLVLHN